MIKLDVKEYCQRCMDFSAEVTEPIKYEVNNNQILQTDTIVQCEYRRRCEAIRRYLESQMKTEEAVG